MKSFYLYWLPNCSTCKKAAQFLENQNVEITGFRNLKENPLSREEVENSRRTSRRRGRTFFAACDQIS